MIFDYPNPRSHRRHSPLGYLDYSSFRPWLRDEFAFRCVYCLKREAWGQVTGEFDLDHFQPQAIRPELTVQYENLVYACRRCNGVKASSTIDDPFTVLVEGRIRSLPDGTVLSRDHAAKRIELILDLNSPRMIEWRHLWTRIIALAKSNDSELFNLLTRVPIDLPDLSVLKPPGGNARPEGIAESWAIQTKAKAGE